MQIDEVGVKFNKCSVIPVIQSCPVSEKIQILILSVDTIVFLLTVKISNIFSTCIEYLKYMNYNYTKHLGQRSLLL